MVVGCGLSLTTAAFSQITVVSEFQPIDPFGQTVKEDRQDTQRDILSPAVARNAIASFRIVVDIPQASSTTSTSDSIQKTLSKRGFTKKCFNTRMMDGRSPMRLSRLFFRIWAR